MSEQRQSVGTGSHGYVAGFNGKEVEIWADSAWAATVAARLHFKAPVKRQHEVWVVLCEKPGGEQVVHVAVN